MNERVLRSAAGHRSFRLLRLSLAAVLVGCGSTAANAAEPASKPSVETAKKSGWWHRGYLVDYGLVGLGLAGYVLRNNEPTTSAMFGPVYDPNDPAAILDSKHSNQIGRAHLEEGEGETVSTKAATITVFGSIGALAVEQGIQLLRGRNDARFVHQTMIGYLETVALTGGINSVIKNAVGRLRPDFQDRARRYHCNKGDIDKKHCADNPPPLHEDADENEHIWFDGRRSFMSGHSASMMNTATYLSLSIGGQYVWGDKATSTSRSVGLLAQTALMTTGIFIAASRFDDGRHHFSDVMTGSLFGFAVANFSYWRRFGADGQPLKKADPGETSVQLDPGPGDAGLALTVRY